MNWIRVHPLHLRESAFNCMPPEVNQYQASDGYTLAYRHWPPSREPRGYVVALHGIQSHSGWYEWSSGRLCEAGYDVRFPDRRGSGRNSQDRGHAPHWRRLVNDVAQFLQIVRRERDRSAAAAPVVLLSVSWGGKLAAALTAQRPELVDGLALLYPGIFSKIGPSPWQRLLLRLGEFWGVDRKLIDIPLDDPALFTDNPEWQEFIRRDELALHQVTTGFLYANRHLGEMAAAAAPRIRCPTLVMLAGRDRIIDNDATRKFYRRLTASGSRLIEYPHAAHTLEFDSERETFVRDLLEWLQAVQRRDIPADSPVYHV